MIPKNNLDDRTFTDIVDEAIRLIPRYCPEWTNHNPTDPGITLVELFAWMTEMTLYRLNQVPEKTYLSLLELMGLSLNPPQPARAVIQFFLVEGYKKSVIIKAGTQIAAAIGGDATYIFETEQDVTVLNNKLSACINRSGEHWTDFCEDGKVKPFMLFETTDEVQHILYISSPVFAYLSAEHTVQIAFASANEIASVKDEIINFLYWEYWDGRTWVHISPRQTIGKRRKKDNVIYFTGPENIEMCTVNGTEAYFLRAVLSEVPENNNALSITNIELQTYFGGTGFMPDLCLCNTGAQYTPIDMNTTFRIFSENPGYNEVFYIAADEVFCKPGNRVNLIFTFSEIYVPGDENENVLFAYEYWDKTAWKKLGESPQASKQDNPYDFRDGTFAFKSSGEVRFTVPHDLAMTTVNNEERYWIRIRLLTRDFSLGGQYYRDEKDNWLWQFSSKVHSPVFSRIRLTYNAGAQKPVHLLTNSNFVWNELLLPNDNEETNTIREIKLFDVTRDTVPTLFLGFATPFPKGTVSFYVKIDDERSAKPKRKLPSFFDEKLLPPAEEARLLDLAWEYWNGKNWNSLSVNDFTDSFHESGFIEFVTPQDITEKLEFGKQLSWLRLRFVSGSFESQPYVISIILNAVYGQNKTSYTKEIAGSGTGAPAQSAMPAHGPLLPGIKLCIDEGSMPPANEIEVLKEEGIAEPCMVDGESVWVQYKEVDNFYVSTPLSRHFVVDYKENRIYFGDGQKGVNPPRRKFNIRLDSYSTGGGAAGNVAAGTLRTLIQSVPFIAGCNNPFPAEGGADMESVNNLKSRAAGVFKSLQRAVTGEDFEWLSMEASSSVGRAWCLKEKNKNGEICVVIIPVVPSGADLSHKLIPSRELLRRVTSYLDERKLVGTKISVQAPRYRLFTISLRLVFKSDVFDEERLKKDIETSLRTFFHALYGDTGSGWEFGKAVTTGAALKQLEKVEGILSVDSVNLFDDDAGVVVEKFLLKEDELPYLDDIHIENRKDLV